MSIPTNDHRAHERVSGPLVWALMVGVTILAAGAFTLSFDALRTLAIAAGLRERLAWLWPVIVDGFIVVATVAAVVLRGRGRASWYPWLALAAAATVSIAGNALHARTTADLTVLTTTTACIVSAVPAVALLLASHLLVIVMEARSASAVTRTPTTLTTPPVPDTPHSPRLAPPSSPSASAAEVVAATPAVSVPPGTGPAPPAPPAPAPAGGEVAEQIAWIRHRIDAGHQVTGGEVAARFGLSAATGRRRITQARDLPGGLTTSYRPA
ncbi:MAG: DUF2637 domain-containing protein [Aeromicrobium sp.]|uniref:DUF2637 domain-containing protein n=1 Tax=Aeromicrobium sp. TaxID=1871063 RepID=UPI0039E2C58E